MSLGSTIILSDYNKGAITDWQLQRLNTRYKYKYHDCPLYIDPKGKLFIEYLPKLRDVPQIIFTPNRNECQQLFAYDNYWRDDSEIRKDMIHYSTINPRLSFLFKKSEAGLEWISNKHGNVAYPIPALKKAEEVVDVCGAGDVTLAAFVHAQLISPSNTPNAWLKFANAAASISVGYLGNYQPSFEEILEEVKKYEV